jgi:hypothetical protein
MTGVLSTLKVGVIWSILLGSNNKRYLVRASECEVPWD